MAGAMQVQLRPDSAEAVEAGLRQAFAVSMDVMLRSPKEALKHAMILMAQSAGKLAKRAPARRKIQEDHTTGRKLRFVEILSQKAPPSRLYEFQFAENHPGRLQGTFQDAQRIGQRGLAGRSWTWGLRRLGVEPKGRAIPGVATLIDVRSPDTVGYILKNALSYMLHAMPPGWEATVQTLVTHKIMHQAKLKLERDWQAAMRRNVRGAVRAAGALLG